MESNNGPEPGPDHRRVSVVQLICRAYGLSDASEITVEHIYRYVNERRRRGGEGAPRPRPAAPEDPPPAGGRGRRGVTP